MFVVNSKLLFVITCSLFLHSFAMEDSSFSNTAMKEHIRNNTELINAMFESSLTPLMFCISHKEFKPYFHEFLKEDVDAKDNKGRTALMLAVELNQEDAVLLLLLHGANILLRDNDDHPVFAYNHSQNGEITRMLLRGIKLQEEAKREKVGNNAPGEPEKVTKVVTDPANGLSTELDHKITEESDFELESDPELVVPLGEDFEQKSDSSDQEFEQTELLPNEEIDDVAYLQKCVQRRAANRVKPKVSKSRSAIVRQNNKRDGRFVCNRHGCGKALGARYQLKEHKNAHDNIKPNKCIFCGYRTAYRSRLVNHQKTCSKKA